jgi:hypothetical protein
MRRLAGVLVVTLASPAADGVLFVPAADWLAVHDVGHVTRSVAGVASLDSTRCSARPACRLEVAKNSRIILHFSIWLIIGS